MGRTCRRIVVAALAVAVSAQTVAATPAVAAPDSPWVARQEKSVPGTNAVPVPPEPDPAEGSALRGAPAVSWPRPGSAEVTFTDARAGRVRAGDLPVFVGPVASAGPAGMPAKVRVEVLDRRLDGPVLRVARADTGAGTGTVSVEVDYSAFRNAFGGDWAARLRLASLPACAITTPDREECRAAMLATRNDGSGRLSADAEVPGGSDGALFAVTAAESSPAGDFKASPLAPTATWTAGGQSGDFTWSYPIQTRPSLGGPAPEPALAYSSGGVDGRTSAANNQPSWVGDGFEFSPGGHIERRYVGCAQDTKGGNNSTRKTGDLCWRTDNATFSLNGKGGELVRDDADRLAGRDVWHPRNDDGSRVERLKLPTGQVNGDNDGEYWRITTRTGMKFYFGLNQLPGWSALPEGEDKKNKQTASVWTVPVYGNHVNEPCHTSTFVSSACYQAWRWNLDYVVDPHGNTMSYFYTTERNHYARNLTATAASWYIRGGFLSRIDYGQRDGEVFTTKPVGQVEMTAADRCAPDTVCDLAHPNSWPDTPLDQNCGSLDPRAPSPTNCKDHYSPTFWTHKRLAKITTRALSGDTFKDVASWTLNHSYLPTGDNTYKSYTLWLASIKRTGLVGGTLDLPETTFVGVQLPNRVDAIDGFPPINRYRIQTVRSETGGELAVNYLPKECSASTGLPAPDSNGKRCHPLKWTPDTPDNQAPQRTDWFNKYVVGSVSEKDLTTGAPPTETHYEYPRAPAWRHDDEDGLVPEERKTWSQWRGYDQVKVRKGHPGHLRSLTESLYFRGMDQDKTASGGRKTVTVRDSTGKQWPDTNEFAGTEREKITYTADGGTMLSRTITDPWLSEPTATSARTWGTTKAYHVEESKVRQSQAITGGRWRETGADNSYDGRGVLLHSADFNDLANPDDDTCTRYSYATNEAAGMVELRSGVQTVATSCDRQPGYPDDVISDERVYYDGNDTFGAPPVRGDVTRKEEISGWVDGKPTYVTISRASYDVYGRPLDTYNVFNEKSSMAYAPATRAPPTRVTETNPLGHVLTVELEPAWGKQTAAIDPNNRRAEAAYDPLGRVTKVWRPGRDRASQGPSEEFGYLVRATGPNVVTSKELQPDGGYLTKFELYDGQMRLRQTQTPAPGGGRTLVDHVYDERGLEIKQNGPYYNDAPPGTDLLVPDELQLTAQTVIEFDGADRPVNQIFKVEGEERWRTSETHLGDRQDTDPPTGDTPTSRIFDAEGRLLELRQYKGNTPIGDYDKTSYSYTRRGQLASVTDPAGNNWRYGYDLRGRKIRTEDPDRGVTEYTYDDANRVLTHKDARGATIAYEYDKLGRKTAVRDGTVTGPKRAEWTYDTLALGLPTTSTRYVDGNAYTTSFTGYDAGNRPTGSTVTIPASEGKLAGTYRFGLTYHPDGEAATISLPATGGLPAETLSFGYNNFGLPTTLSGSTTYVTGSAYTPYAEPQQVTLSAGGKWVRHTIEYETGTRRLSRAVTDRETAPVRVSNVSYDYDPGGNVTRIADEPGELPADVQCFRYDYLRRLTTAWTPGSGDCRAEPAAAAALGGPAPYWHSWTFDKVGNRLSQTKTAPNGAVTASTYTYPAAGQPHPHALQSVTTNGKTDEYGYDATGNTIRRPGGTAGQVLDWDVEGHLSTITENGKTTSFVYDANGNRIIRHDPDGATLYLNETEVRVDSTGLASATRYYSFNGQTVGVRTSDGKLTWLGLDHHGTAQVAIDAQTQEVQRRRSTPYGELRGAAPAWWPGERGFVGGTNDRSTGLTHLGAREYDQATGRFISVDPVMDHNDPQQLHGYAYGNNSPVTVADPDGRWGFITTLVNVTKTIVHTIVRKVIVPVTAWYIRTVHRVVNFVHSLITIAVKFVKYIARTVVQTVRKTVHYVRKVIKKVSSSARTLAQKIDNQRKQLIQDLLKRASHRLAQVSGRIGDMAAQTSAELGTRAVLFDLTIIGLPVGALLGWLSSAHSAIALVGHLIAWASGKKLDQGVIFDDIIGATIPGWGKLLGNIFRKHSGPGLGKAGEQVGGAVGRGSGDAATVEIASRTPNSPWKWVPTNPLAWTIAIASVPCPITYSLVPLANVAGSEDSYR